MNRKNIDKTKYIMVFIITTFIFIAGLLIGEYTSRIKLSSIEALTEEIRIDTASLELEYLLLSAEPCMIADYSAITAQVYDIGSRLAFMENSLGNNNKEVIRQKEYYSLLEIRQWLLLKKANTQCSLNDTLILYFYSNAGDCDLCPEQGFVLDVIKRKYPNVKVYSFDINLNNAALQTLKNIYKINGSPSLVIDEKIYTGFMNSAQIERSITEENEKYEK